MLPDLPTNCTLIAHSFVCSLLVATALKMNTANTVPSGPFTKPAGVYSIQTNQHTKSGGTQGGGGERGNTNTSQKSPRKPTPANPHHVDHRGPLHNVPTPLQPTIEVDEVDSDDGRRPSMTLSPAAQAHSLSLFLSSSTSDSGKHESKSYCHN